MAGVPDVRLRVVADGSMPNWQAASVRMFAVEQAAKAITAIVTAPDATSVTWDQVSGRIRALAVDLEQHVVGPQPPVVDHERSAELLRQAVSLLAQGRSTSDGSSGQGAARVRDWAAGRDVLVQAIGDHLAVVGRTEPHDD